MLNIISLIVILALTTCSFDTARKSSVSPAEAIPFKEFRVDPFVAAAAKLQAASEEKAVLALRDFCKEHPAGSPVDAFITVAAKLQAAGEEKAVSALRNFCKEHPEQGDNVIVLYRMLFTAKPKGVFRAPKRGSPSSAMGTPDRKDWPLWPIEIVEGIPFLIAPLYGGLGNGIEYEPTEKYLEYCIKSCDWNTVVFKPVNAEQKQKALEKLLVSKNWKKPPTDADKKFLASQIK